jgi:hypothetical protein
MGIRHITAAAKDCANVLSIASIRQKSSALSAMAEPTSYHSVVRGTVRVTGNPSELITKGEV